MTNDKIRLNILTCTQKQQTIGSLVYGMNHNEKLKYKKNTTTKNDQQHNKTGRFTSLWWCKLTLKRIYDGIADTKDTEGVKQKMGRQMVSKSQITQHNEQTCLQ